MTQGTEDGGWRTKLQAASTVWLNNEEADTCGHGRGANLEGGDLSVIPSASSALTHLSKYQRGFHSKFTHRSLHHVSAKVSDVKASQPLLLKELLIPDL